MNLVKKIDKFTFSIIDKKERALKQVIRIIPRWITPNHLAWLRLILVVPVVYLLWHEYFVWGLIVFFFAMLLDVLDGTLARQRDQITSLGKILDPVADKTLFILTFAILALKFLDFYTLSFVIVAEILTIVQFFVLLPFLPIVRKWKIDKKIGANPWGKFKAVFQVLGVILIVIGIFYSPIIWAATVVFWIATIMCLASTISHQVRTTSDKSLRKTKL